mmetsp:Transcript_24014/g.37407  ORF Transcript_24014/g.37407 Transcript_24014/m.37407 type:complete len:222 (-) Transcript_24014:38-703(-)
MSVLLFLSSDTEDPVHHDLLRSSLYQVFQHSKDNFFIDWFSGTAPLVTFSHSENDPRPPSRTVIKKCCLRFQNERLIVFEFDWWEFKGVLSIPFLPYTVEELTLKHSDAAFTLQTRCFPRNAKLIDMQSNRIVGSLALDELPENLEVLYLMANDLRGNVRFQNLPKRLRVLYLARNKGLGNETVYYGDLPETLKTVNVRATNIQSVLPLPRTKRVKGVFLF